MDPKATVFAAIEQPTKKVRSLVDEFEKFAFKGNVIDMAVGVIIGAAFGKIVDSLVKHIILPTVNLLMPSNADYTELVWRVGENKTIPYGQFLGEIVNFLIVALALFFFTVKFLGWIRRFRTKADEAAPAVAEKIRLLTEIRDLLKANTAPASDLPRPV